MISYIFSVGSTVMIFPMAVSVRTTPLSLAVAQKQAPGPVQKKTGIQLKCVIKQISANLLYRRKFRSQTSDNIDRWKSRGVKSQGGEEKK